MRLLRLIENGSRKDTMQRAIDDLRLLTKEIEALGGSMPE